MKITVGVVGLGLIGASFAKAYKENEEEAKPVRNKISIINMVNKVRDFVDDFDDDRINTKEEDFPDRYRIIIEIEKDVN